MQEAVQPWWVTPMVTLLVAVVTVGGTILTVSLTRRTQEKASMLEENRALRKENSILRGRILKVLNYAGRLRDAHYRGDPPPPEPWPEDIYDEHED